MSNKKYIISLVYDSYYAKYGQPFILCDSLDFAKKVKEYILDLVDKIKEFDSKICGKKESIAYSYLYSKHPEFEGVTFDTLKYGDDNEEFYTKFDECYTLASDRVNLIIDRLKESNNVSAIHYGNVNSNLLWVEDVTILNIEEVSSTINLESLKLFKDENVHSIIEK